MSEQDLLINKLKFKIFEQEKTIQGLLVELNEQDERTKKLLRRADKGLRRAARKRRRLRREVNYWKNSFDENASVVNFLKSRVEKLEDLLEIVKPAPSFWNLWGLL